MISDHKRSHQATCLCNRYDLTPTFELSTLWTSDRICITTTWSTESTVRCRAPYELSGTVRGSMTVSAVIGTRQNFFSFGAPVVSFSSSENAVHTSHSIVTIHGLSFAMVDTTTSFRIAHDLPCLTTGWSSTTTMQCMALIFMVLHLCR